MIQPKKSKQINVPNKEHPRYKAYVDSLYLYNRSRYNNTLAKDENLKSINKYNELKKIYEPELAENVFKSKADDFTPTTPNGSKIKPISNITYTSKTKNSLIPKSFAGTYNKVSGNEGVITFNFKAPEEKVNLKSNSPTKLIQNKKLIGISKDKINTNKSENINNFSKSNDKVEFIQNNLKPQDVIKIKNPTINPTIISPIIKPPNSYKIHEEHGNGNTTDYEVNDLNNINTDVNRTRTITPKFDLGGKLNTMKTIKRLPKTKNYYFDGGGALSGIAGVASTAGPWGAAVGAGLGLIQSTMAGQDVADARQEQVARIMANQAVEDAAYLKTYNTKGTNDVNYYAGGGNLRQGFPKGKYATIGGDLESLSSNAEVAEGNTHGENKIDGQYGITLHDAQGNPKAEIEDDEVIVDNEKVFSDRLKYNSKNTFAQMAKKIATKAGKLEEKLEGIKDTKDRNGLERNLAGMKMAHEVLFNKQEEVKQSEGHKELKMLAAGGYIPKMGYGDLIDPPTYRPNYKRRVGNAMLDELSGPGSLIKGMGKIKDGLPNPPSAFSEMAPSLIDNAAGLIMANNSPKVPKPILNRYIPMKTSVDATPQLAAIANTTKTNRDDILGNTSNSSIARANIASSNLRGNEQKMGVLGQKENIETQLKNQDTEARMKNASENNKLSDEYNKANYERSTSINRDIMKNISNMSADFADYKEKKDLTKFYDADNMADLLDDPTGEKLKAAQANPYFNKSPEMMAALKKEYARRNLPAKRKFNYNGSNSFVPSTIN
jgi:hypothetical protein